MAASRSGMWWNWMFWRVVMWPLPSGAYCSVTLAEGVHLVGRDAAERELDADHLHVGLALAVDALLQAEADELRPRRLPVEELRRLGVEVVELALEDRDDVTGDVLDDLWVRERAGRPVVFDSMADGSMSFCLLRWRVREHPDEAG